MMPEGYSAMKRVFLKLPDPLAAELDDMARRTDIGMSALIRTVLTVSLQENRQVRTGSALAQVAKDLHRPLHLSLG